MIAVLLWDNLPITKVIGETLSLYGLPCLVLRLSPAPPLLGFRLRKAGRLLHSQGVRRLLLPPDFTPTQWQGLGPGQIRPVNPLPTLQALAGEALLPRLSPGPVAPDRAQILLHCQKISPAITQVAQTLAPQVAQLILPPVPGAKALQAALLDRYGMAPCGFQTHPTACLCFCEKAPEHSGLLLQFHQLESSGFCGFRLKFSQIPQDFPFLPTLALLLQRGVVKKNDLEFT